MKKTLNFFTTHDARWIGLGKSEHAPWFFTTFDCPDPRGVQVAICGLGYYQLVVNGQRVGDRELTPTVTIYDRRVRYNVYDLSGLLVSGKNAVGVVLGPGWYDHQVGDVWNFDNATWKHPPVFILELRDAAGALLLASNQKWLGSLDGPILSAQLRSGEVYDARKAFPDWGTVEFKPADDRWQPAALQASPGGLLEEETATPCRVTRTFPLTGSPTRLGVYDCETNISGRCRITVVSRTPGARVELTYTERITEDGASSGLAQDMFVKAVPFQREVYLCRGGGSEEVWESHFTYHGFRYVGVRTSGGDVEVRKLEVRQIHSDFASVGSLETSQADLNRLQAVTCTSYLANFVGIPTDCPHREKNGWTGDAQLACETGLYNFDAAPGYLGWLDTLVDCQRPNGALPGIAPASGWGYNWGNGPNWDGALFVIPYQIYLRTGDASVLQKYYEPMRRYLDFCDTVTEDDIVCYGLGDWCPPREIEMVDSTFSTTATYQGLVALFAKIAALLGRKDDAAHFTAVASRIKLNFNKKFYRGEGVYADGGLTAQATPLYYGLCPDGEAPRVLEKLVTAAEPCGCTARFGILGAKYVPRVLAENGHADLALRFFTQEAYPGWVHWLRRGAVSLWETWDGASSRNHIMFGDVSAWLFQYAAGFEHRPEHPGWKRLAVRPRNLKALDGVKAEYRGYRVAWSREGGVFSLTLTVPEGCRADVFLPGGSTTVCGPGTHTLRDKAPDGEDVNTACLRGRGGIQSC